MDGENNGASKMWTIAEIDALLGETGGVDGEGNVQPGEAEPVPGDVDRRETVPAAAAEAAAASGKTVRFDPRPTRRGEVSHNINREKVERSRTGDITPPASGGMEYDKYRERFMNKPKKNIEKTAEHSFSFGKDPAKPIENPGVVQKTGKFGNTQDLDPLPTIVPAAEVYEEDRRIREGDDDGVKPDDSQIKLTGFEEEEAVPKVDEQEAERRLKERRNEKINDFTLERDGIKTIPEPSEGAQSDESADVWSEEPENPEKPKKHISPLAHVPGRDSGTASKEYRTRSDRESFSSYLGKSYNNTLIGCCVQGAALFLILVAGFLPSEGVNGFSFDVFGGSERIFLLISLLFTAVAAIPARHVLINGVRALVRRAPTAESCCAAVLTAAVIQTLVFFFASGNVLSTAPLYSGAAVASLLFFNLGHLQELMRMKRNFKFISDNDGQLYSVRSIEDESTAFEIGRGLLLGEPDVKSVYKTEFPANFAALSTEKYPSDRFCKKALVLVASAAAIIGIAAGFVGKSAVFGISAFTAALAIGCPVSAFLADNAVIGGITERLSRRGGMISGYAAAEDCTLTNAVVLDASDILKLSECSIHGIKTFHSMRVDEAILYTAAIVIEGGGPLSGIFRSVVLDRTDILPPVESLAYEDKLGLSAWIHNRRVLVGSRDLLNNHNVATPGKDIEDKYLHDGRCPLYLAIDGKIAALFIVSYGVSEDTAALLRRTERNGVTLLVKTADANITEEMISTSLRLPLNGTKVLNAVAGDLYDTCRREVLSSDNAAILCDGSTDAFLRCVNASFTVTSMRRITSILLAAGMGIGLAFVFILSLLSGLTQVGALSIVIYQVIWALIVVAFPRFRRR